MSDGGDDQDLAEALDSDKIDPLDFPPDRASGVEDLLDDDVTSAGDFAPDDLATRISREEPDVLPAADEGEVPDIAAVAPGGITAPDDPFGPDGAGELIGEAGEVDSDVDGLVTSESAAAGHGTDVWPAEEAAMHVVEEPE
jgi:hypothetical protein